jgi:molybdopterin-guanine dinucleotide biosynthesis protein A
VARKPCTRSKSSPGVRMVTASAVTPSRISSGSSAATVSGRVVCTGPRMRSTGVRLVTLPTHTTLPTFRLYRDAVDPLPPYTAVVLAGGRAARLGGQAKPQLMVGGRPILAAVLDAVAGAERRIVVGPPQPVPADVVLVREHPPGGGPVAAVRAGLDGVTTEVVLVLAGDLPFLTRALIDGLRERLTGDGVLVVDDTGRDQYLLGAWRTVALKAAVAQGTGPTSLRRVLAPIAVRRWRPEVGPDQPPPWLDCDTPADLARARAVAGDPPEPRPAAPASLLPRFQAPRDPP